MKEYLMKGTKQSSMRLGFIISIYTSCFGGILLGVLDLFLNSGNNLLGVAAIIGAMSGSAFFGKVKQTQVEEEKVGNE